MNKIFFTKLSFFLFMLQTATIYGAVHTPLAQLSSESTQNTIEESAHKMLQNEALIQADALLRYIHQIGLRIEKLKLKKDTKKEITETINGIREKLEKLKISHSLCIDSAKLSRFIMIIEALTEAIEGSLKSSFTIMPTINSHNIKRSQSVTAVDPAELHKQLVKNTQRLKKFDSLISTINLNWFQRGYRVASDVWNTPLYTFDSLGKADLYISSILKRLIVYPATLGLVVYNINPKIIESIPLKGVRENLMKFKIWTGRTPYEEAKTRNDSYIPVEEEFIQEGFKIDGILLKTDESGFPLIEKITTNNSNSLYKLFGVNSNSLYKLCGVNGETLTFTSEQDARNAYSYDSYKYAVTDNKNIFYEVKKSGPQSYKTVTQGIPVAIGNDKTLQPLPQFTPQSPYRNVTTQDGTMNQHIPVPKNWVQQSDGHHSTVEIGSQVSESSIDSRGLINSLRYGISWLVEPDLKSVFTLPVAGYLTTFIYQDIKSVQENLPFIKSYLHNKARGENITINMPGLITTPTENFDSIVGRKDIKNKLQPIIDFIKNPLNYIQSGIQLPRGVILTGEPQTGKTSTVKALAGELNKQLQAIGNNKSVGVLPVSVAYIKKYGLNYCMEQAKNHAPCILFCDEFDLLQAQRDKDAVLLSDILEGLNGYHTSSDLKNFVIFMIATNRPEHIDFAVTENGRCGMTLYFENPHIMDRTEYFKSFFKKKLIDIEDEDIQALAEETEACSYGTLIEVANASLRFAESSKEVVQKKHITMALNLIVRKIVTEGYNMPLKQKEVLSARYGAQACISLAVNPIRKLTAVTIYKITEKIIEKDLSINHYEALSDRSGHAGIKIGGIFSYNTQDTYNLISDSELIKGIKIIVAGSIGQKVLGVDEITFPEDEINALNIAHKLVFKGIHEKMYPQSIREEKKLEAYMLVQNCKKEIQELLESKQEELMNISQLLQKRNLLHASDINRCLGKSAKDMIDYFSKKTNITESATESV